MKENNYWNAKIGKEPGWVEAEQEETEASTLTLKMGAQTNSKSDKTSTTISISESTFQCFFWIKKRPPYAQVMAKKLTTTPNNTLAGKLQIQA